MRCGLHHLGSLLGAGTFRRSEGEVEERPRSEQPVEVARMTRSERAQLDPAECMTDRALDLDLARWSQRTCALGEPTLRDRVQVVEIDD